MKFSDKLKFAFGELKRRKGRTFLTALAVAIGSMLVMTLVGMGTSFQSFIQEQVTGQADTTIVVVRPLNIINKKPEFKDMNEYRNFMEKNYHKITEKNLAKFKKLKGVKDVAATIDVRISQLTINKKKQSNIYAQAFNTKYKIFDDNYIDYVRKANNDKKLKPILKGRNLNSKDYNSVLIGEGYLKTIGIKDKNNVVGKEITLTTSTSESGLVALKPLNIKAKVVGIINKKFGDFSDIIVMPSTLGNKIKSYYTLKDDYIKEKGFDQVSLHAKDAGNVSTVGKEMKKLNYTYASRESIAKEIDGAFVIIKEVLAILGLIVLFVATLGIINTMIMAINERTKSIGIMKSLGASQKDINGIFLVQSGSIGFIGGIMGLLFSLLNTKIIEAFIQSKIKGDLQAGATIHMTVPIWLILVSVGFSILIAVLSGVYPASKAAKLDPVEALNSK
jgi:putative ABC transport system permease protein